MKRRALREVWTLTTIAEAQVVHDALDGDPALSAEQQDALVGLQAQNGGAR